MKTYSSTFLQTINNPFAYLPICWRITREDGIVIGTTEFDYPLVIDGVTYVPSAGFDPSDVDRSLENNANQISLRAPFSDLVSESDILGGVFNNAKIFVFRVDPHNLPSTLSPVSGIYEFEPLVSGQIGRFTLTDLGYTAEARGLQERLSTRQGEVTSKTCRNKFGDSICGKNLADYTVGVSVTGVIDSNKFTISNGSNYYLGGKLTWTSGNNQGQTSQVIFQNGAEIHTLWPFKNPIQVNDTAQLQRNCDKQFTTCVSIFGNQNNFQGEPALPGQDDLSRRADL